MISIFNLSNVLTHIGGSWANALYDIGHDTSGLIIIKDNNILTNYYIGSYGYVQGGSPSMVRFGGDIEFNTNKNGTISPTNGSGDFTFKIVLF